MQPFGWYRVISFAGRALALLYSFLVDLLCHDVYRLKCVITHTDTGIVAVWWAAYWCPLRDPSSAVLSVYYVGNLAYLGMAWATGDASGLNAERCNWSLVQLIDRRQLQVCTFHHSRRGVMWLIYIHRLMLEWWMGALSRCIFYQFKRCKYLSIHLAHGYHPIRINHCEKTVFFMGKGHFE